MTKSIEIKFRGWDNRKKEMKYFNNLCALYNHGEFVGVCSPFEGYMDDCYVQELKEGSDKYDNDIEIMQYTGLLDKNGKEIYEGDIVVDVFGFGEHYSVVKFGKYIFGLEGEGCSCSGCEHEVIGWYLEQLPSSNRNYCNIEPLEDIQSCYKICGNIYKHPNLTNHE